MADEYSDFEAWNIGTYSEAYVRYLRDRCSLLNRICADMALAGDIEAARDAYRAGMIRVDALSAKWAAAAAAEVARMNGEPDRTESL